VYIYTVLFDETVYVFFIKNWQDQSGNTPLHIAIIDSKDSIFSDIIGSHDLNAIDPTLCNKEGLNLLHLACSKNNTQ
jgi:hypothetical protein